MVGVPGSAGRNSLEQPGYQNWDMSLFKRLPYQGEGQLPDSARGLQTLFNHTNFGGANTGLSEATNPTTGQVALAQGNFGSINIDWSSSHRADRWEIPVLNPYRNCFPFSQWRSASFAFQRIGYFQ